jgi:hypothetical protein
VAELSTLNIRNADRIVDRAFATHGHTYFESVMEQATTLMERSAESRNELASIINTLRPTLAVADAEDDEDEGDDGIDMASAIRPVEISTVQPVVPTRREPHSVLLRGNLREAASKLGGLFN